MNHVNDKFILSLIKNNLEKTCYLNLKPFFFCKKNP